MALQPLQPLQSLSASSTALMPGDQVPPEVWRNLPTATPEETQRARGTIPEWIGEVAQGAANIALPGVGIAQQSFGAAVQVDWIGRAATIALGVVFILGGIILSGGVRTIVMQQAKTLGVKT